MTNVATLPGIVGASYAMPDAHWGYGFPIGGVAAFDPDEGGVVSAGGVGFDISCGVRTLLTGLTLAEIEPRKNGAGRHAVRGDSRGRRQHRRAAPRAGGDGRDADRRRALGGGRGLRPARGPRPDRGGRARWPGADPRQVSDHAKRRQRDEMGTLGSGNHYLEVQHVVEIFDRAAARDFGLAVGDVVVSIHCGSRGLGHQIGTEFLREMALAAKDFGHRPARPRTRLRADPLGDSASATSARCARRSTARSPTARSSPT